MVRKELNNIKDVIDYQIYKFARGTGLEYKELYQIGYLGYLKSLNKMDPERGISLAYAGRYIQQELTTFIKKEQKERAYRTHLRAPVWAPDSDPLWQIPDTKQKNPTDNVIIEKLRELMSKLRKEEAYIIQEFYFADRPKRLKDLADEMGVKKQRVHEIKDLALQKLREMCKKQNISLDSVIGS